MDEVLTARNLLDSANNPRITYGGQSSSTALNAINENLRADLLAIDAEVASVEDLLEKNKAMLSCQSGAMGAAVLQVYDMLTDVRAALVSGSGRVPIDMFDDRYVVGAETTASVDTLFGQATLAIAGSSDWLVAQDMTGQTWVPKSTRIRYACNDDGHVPNGYGGDSSLVDEYSEDPEFTAALDGDPGTMWVREKTHAHFWVEIQVPVDVMTNTLANTLVLRPFPVLCHDLVSVDIFCQSGNVMTLSGDKLKYLPGYSKQEQVVKTIADTRIFFPPTQVAAVRLHFRAGNHQFWGFSEIAVKTTTFQATSNLVVDLTSVRNGKTLKKITLRGDDEPYLGTIPANISGSKVTYGLTQQGAGYTPVITLLDTEWS